MPALLLDSLGLSTIIDREAGPSTTKTKSSSLFWNSCMICGGGPNDEYESDLEEVVTVQITNRGSVCKSEKEKKGDDSTLGSLVSDLTASTYSDSSESVSDESSIRLLYENTLENSCDDEDTIFDGLSQSEHEKIQPEMDVSTSQDLGTSSVKDMPVEENRSARDESRQGTSSTSPPTLETHGISKKSRKKSSRGFLGLWKTSKKTVASRASKIEIAATTSAGQECEKKDSESVTTNESHSEAREQAPSQNDENDQVVLLHEKMVLKHNHRGQLITQSNLEELINSVDPKDFRNRVLGVSNGFEIVRPLMS